MLLLAACENGEDDGSGAPITPPTDTPAPPVLRIHHIDAEQGDAALIVSPEGETAMVDNGDMNECANVLTYLDTLGITSIDYHFASHYHADHIGCLGDMAAAGITVATACYDRGGSYDSNVFRNDYRDICGDKRQTVSQGQVITLDAGAAHPVTITVVDLDGAGVSMSSSEENGRSLVLLLTYGSFDEVLAGDLTGVDPYPLVESTVAPQVGDVEVYKVNHHGSKYCSSDAWLNATTPEVAIISVGDNDYGHPTGEALSRLHNHAVTTYWTNLGSGATPDPGQDHVVDGAIVIEAEPVSGGQFTVSGATIADTYTNQ
jgi:beta-lactamase superfamily II metal-dependent hydrolase